MHPSAAFWTPPVPAQVCPSTGFPLSGYGTNKIPHAPLSVKVLCITVSLGGAGMAMPGPGGPAAALPARGVLMLLLSWTSLCMNTQHEWVWVIRLMASPGHCPFAGAGGSPPIWVLVSKPSSLLSNWEFSTTIDPPEFVPEYPR